MVYGLAWRACYGILYCLAGIAWCVVWTGGHRMVYGMAWRASHSIWLWPGRQGTGLGIVYGMAWRAWHCIWYGLADKQWYMVWPGGHGIT